MFNNMRKTIIAIVILLVILAGIISYIYFNLGSAGITGKAIINSIKHDLKLNRRGEFVEQRPTL